jgi:hypothetical protein
VGVGLAVTVELLGRAGRAGPFLAGKAGKRAVTDEAFRAESDCFLAGSIGGSPFVVRPGDELDAFNPTEVAPWPFVLGRSGGVGGADTNAGIVCLAGIGRGALMTGGDLCWYTIEDPFVCTALSGEATGDSNGLSTPARSIPGDVLGDSNGLLEVVYVCDWLVICCRAEEASVTVLLLVGGRGGGFGETVLAGDGGGFGVVGLEGALPLADPNLAARAATETLPSCWSSASCFADPPEVLKEAASNPRPPREGVLGLEDPTTERGGGTGGGGLLLAFLDGLAGGVVPPLLPAPP